MVPFDAKRLEVSGAPVRVLTGVSHWNRKYSHLEVSPTGTLVFIAGSPAAEARRLMLVDRAGTKRDVLDLPKRQYVRPRISPDGRHVVVESVDSFPHVTWILDLARGMMTRLAEDRHEPTWMADGRHVSFSNSTATQLLKKRADGSSAEELVVDRADNTFGPLPGQWSPDGRWLLFAVTTPTTQRDIVVLGQERNAKPRSVVATRFDERTPAFSPDGRWIAYAADDSGQHEVYVQPFSGGGPRQQVSIGGGTEPVWSRDGRTLFFRQQNRMLAASTGLSGAFTTGRPEVLFAGSFEEWPSRAGYDVTPDGRFLLVERPDETPLTHLRVVLNWFEELKRTAPAK